MFWNAGYIDVSDSFIKKEFAGKIVLRKQFLPGEHFLLKDTHREKAPSDETPALTKSTNMSIWVVGTATL